MVGRRLFAIPRSSASSTAVSLSVSTYRAKGGEFGLLGKLTSLQVVATIAHFQYSSNFIKLIDTPNRVIHGELCVDVMYLIKATILAVSRWSPSGLVSKSIAIFYGKQHFIYLLDSTLEMSINNTFQERL